MNSGEPIDPRSPLGLVLGADPVPDLSPGFADRVLVAAGTRAAPLPVPRRTRGGGRGWRVGRRIAIAATGFGALATAAAATGLLDRLNLPLPSPEKVWASLAGNPVPAVEAPAPVRSASPEFSSDTPPTVVIEGAIDTPAELEEAFRRIDEVRALRTETRRQHFDQQIDRAIERRREAGLPLPNAEDEARLRQRIEQARARREGAAGERIEIRREQLRQKVESGEPITPGDLAPRSGKSTGTAAPALRERLRAMPPEQRRALLREWRERRDRASATPAEAAPVAEAEAEAEAPLPERQAE